MSALSDLQDSVKGVSDSVDAVKLRVDQIPTGGVSDEALAPLTAALKDAKAKLDAIAVPVVA